MLTKTKGIVLRKLNYGETSLIVDIFTEEHGLMSYIMSGVRKPKSRGGSALLQLLAIVDLVAYHSERSKLHRIREVRPAYVFQNIPGDIRKNAIVLFIAELCSKVIRQTERNTALFSILEQSIVRLDRAESDFNDDHLYFMIRLADILGFGPETRQSTGAVHFNLMDGCFTSVLPDHNYYISDADVLNQYLIASRNEDAHRKAADRITRNRTLDTLLLYYQLHIDRMPEMHAHKVLREVL